MPRQARHSPARRREGPQELHSINIFDPEQTECSSKAASNLAAATKRFVPALLGVEHATVYRCLLRFTAECVVGPRRQPAGPY
jgi:hypothetical protein